MPKRITRKAMTTTVNRAYVDHEGRVMAVTMPMPEMPKDIHPRDQYLKAMEEYDKALQQVKDTSVVYEDRERGAELILKSIRRKLAESRQVSESYVASYGLDRDELKPATFYDHDTVEVEILEGCCHNINSPIVMCEHDCEAWEAYHKKKSVNKVARILPIEFTPVMHPTAEAMEQVCRAMDEFEKREQDLVPIVEKPVTSIYIAGKIGDLPMDQVEKNFSEARIFYEELGYKVISPIDLPHNHDKSWASYMMEDLHALIKADEVAMLNNWHDSPGANIEHAFAKRMGKLIHYFNQLPSPPKP
jgi:hypothetical protein